jgi:hypothetical protein
MVNEKWMGCSHIEWEEGFTDTVFDLIKNAKANCIRQQMITDNPYRDNILFYQLNLMPKAKARGLKVLMCTLGTTTWELTPDESVEIILNMNGAGDAWISKWANFISALQPDAAEIMNEPRAIRESSYAGSMSDTDFFEAYRQFVMRCIDAWRAIKPDLMIEVSSCPFWDVTPIFNKPIPRSNIFYGIHFYYADSLPPSDWPEYKWIEPYWNGRFAEAKIELENYMLNDPEVGFARFLNAGLPVFMEETGASLASPNALIFMQDFYDLCKKYNLGVIQHSFAPYPRDPHGLLIEDWSALNEMGLVWQKNMAEGAPPPTPTPTPPIISIIVGAGLGYAVGREPGAAVGALAGAALGSVSFKYRERLTRIGMLGRG